MVFDYRGSERLTSCRFGVFLAAFFGIKKCPREDSCGRRGRFEFYCCFATLGLEKY